MVRFVNSGTEATMSALRLARAFTGRDKIVKFEGGYHGHADGLLVQAGSGQATLSLPDSPGVPASSPPSTLVAPYNDLEAVRLLFDAARATRSPPSSSSRSPANMGVVPPAPGFLEGLRELTREHGALLIFDEVITGFRLRYGGAQDAASASSRTSPAWARSSAAACRSAPTAAGARSWRWWRRWGPSTRRARSPATRWRWPPASPRCERARRRRRATSAWRSAAIYLEDGLRRAAEEAEVPGADQPRRLDAHDVLHRRSRSPTSPPPSAPTPTRYAAYFRGMLDRGVFLPPSQFEAMFVSLAHTDAEIEATIDAARESLAAHPTSSRLARRMLCPVFQPQCGILLCDPRPNICISE